MKNHKDDIRIVQYKWAGKWGPFKIKIPCGECAVTQNIIEDVMNTDFENHKDTLSFEVKEWLPHWWRLLLRGGWHAPIVTINNKVVFQGQAIDRGFLASEIRKELVKISEIPKTGFVIYSKEGCKHCVRAKELFKEMHLEYAERDVVVDPMATAEIFHHTKKFFPKNKPVTTPQIWHNEAYIGGADELEIYLRKQ
jgi:glutaredoxin